MALPQACRPSLSFGRYAQLGGTRNGLGGVGEDVDQLCNSLTADLADLAVFALFAPFGVIRMLADCADLADLGLGLGFGADIPGPLSDAVSSTASMTMSAMNWT